MRSSLGLFFKPWVFIGAFLVSACLLVVTGALFFSTKRPALLASPPTAVVTIFPAPTATIPGVTPSPTETPSPDSLPPPGSENITLGSFVAISGTNGAGLNLRSAPSLNSSINYLGLDSEVFVVTEGPVEADGIAWFFISGFYDETRNGWAASNYLLTIQSP